MELREVIGLDLADELYALLLGATCLSALGGLLRTCCFTNRGSAQKAARELEAADATAGEPPSSASASWTSDDEFEAAYGCPELSSFLPSSWLLVM